jgi:hypothetical protein
MPRQGRPFQSVDLNIFLGTSTVKTRELTLEWTVVELIVRFSYLQIMDLVTTILFLSAGVEEANPFVNLAFRSAVHPWLGLLLVKIIAFAIAFYCWRIGKDAVLVRANRFFACIVAWNIIAVALSVTQWS